MMLTSLDNNYSYEDGDKIICFDALTTEELLTIHIIYLNQNLRKANLMIFSNL